MTTVVRVSSVVSVVLLSVGLYMSLVAGFRRNNFSRGFPSPVLAAQVARYMEEVKMIVGKLLSKLAPRRPRPRHP
jgi:hypothetical protein